MKDDTEQWSVDLSALQSIHPPIHPSLYAFVHSSSKYLANPSHLLSPDVWVWKTLLNNTFRSGYFLCVSYEFMVSYFIDTTVFDLENWAKDSQKCREFGKRYFNKGIHFCPFHFFSFFWHTHTQKSMLTKISETWAVVCKLVWAEVPLSRQWLSKPPLLPFDFHFWCLMH